MSDFREVVFSPLRDVNNGEFSPSTDDTSPTYNSNHNYGDNRNCSGMNSYNHTDVNRPFDSNNGDRRDRESDNFNSNSNYHGDSPNILKFAGGNSSSFGATCNFVNSIVGAGMIGMPLAIEQCGFLMGIFLMAVVAVLVNKSVLMLIECGIKENQFDLELLAKHLLGKRGFYCAMISMFLFAYGAQIAYLVVIADSVPRVADLLLPNSFFTNRHYALLFFAILVILPLCLLRDLSSLSWTSLLSVSSNVILILMIIITVPTVEDNSHNEDKFEASNIFAISYSLFIGIGTMSFAFVCQHNSFIVFRSLATPTFAAWKTVARNSILIAFIICLCFALVGFITFYPNVDGDLLNNFPNNYVTIAIARGLIATGMVFTYPMECFVTRHCIGSLISREQVLSEKGNNQSKKDRHGSRKLNNFIKNQRSSRHVYGSGVYSRTGTVMDGEDGEDDYVENTNRATSGFVELDDTKSDEEEVIEFNQFGGNSDGNRLSSEERDGEGSGIDTEENGGVHLSTTQHVIITLLLWGSSLGIAMIADELGIVLALTGAVAASILGYVLPSTIYLKCNEIEFRQALYGDSGNSNHCGIESSKNEVYNSIRCDSIVNNDDSTTYNNNHTDDIEMVDTLFTHTKHAMSSNYPNNNGKDGKSNADDGDDDDEVCEIEFTSIRIPSDDDHPVNKGTSRWNLLNSNYNYYFQTDNNSGQYRIITAAEELVQSILQLKKFYLPLFMIVFGFLSLFIGVITIIVENV